MTLPTIKLTEAEIASRLGYLNPLYSGLIEDIQKEYSNKNIPKNVRTFVGNLLLIYGAYCKEREISLANVKLFIEQEVWKIALRLTNDPVWTKEIGCLRLTMVIGKLNKTEGDSPTLD